ncbi:hypothetical protein ACS0TY_020501 [Phlomoides rotata]
MNQEGEPEVDVAVDPANQSSSSAKDEDEQNLRHYGFAIDRARMNVHPPERYGIAEDLEYQKPHTFKEVITNKDKELWIVTIMEKLQSLETNCTRKLVDKPDKQKLVAASGSSRGKLRWVKQSSWGSKQGLLQGVHTKGMN